MKQDREEDLIQAFRDIATGLKYLGNGNAASDVGAIENLAMQVEKGCEAIATGLSDLADAIRETKGSSG